MLRSGVRISSGSPFKMFFELSHNFNETFTNCYKIGNMCLSTDNGWKEFFSNGKKAIAKGYSFETSLEVAAFQPPRYRGMFCSIVETDNGIMITHGIPRSFPIYTIDGKITNLHRGNLIPDNQYYVDGTTVSYNLITFKPRIENSLSLDQAIEIIDSCLEENIKGFQVFDDREIKVTVTGGLDTSLIYSYIDNLNIKHVPVIDRIFELDAFVIKNYQAIEENSEFIVDVNHYREPCVVTSGGNGDFYFLRTAEAMSWVDVDRKYKYDPNLDYNDVTYTTHFNHVSLFKKICSCYNIWHLNNTVYFNPLLDIRIPLTIMAVKKHELFDAIKTGQIQKTLIAKRSNWIGNLVSNKKMPNQQLKFLPEVLKKLNK